MQIDLRDASFCNRSGGPIAVRGEVLRGLADENSSKESNDDTGENFPAEFLGICDRDWDAKFIRTEDDFGPVRKALRNDNGNKR